MDAEMDSPEGSSRVELDAMRLLARRPLTEFELSARLESLGHEADAIDGALQAMRRHGYVNDRSLAVDYIVARSDRLGHGPARLLADLVKRGLDAEDAQLAWDQAVQAGDVDPRRLLRRQLRRKIGGRPGRLDRKQYARVYNALLRAGFDNESVRRELGPLPGASDPTDPTIPASTTDGAPDDFP